jgi:hypothetical protein
VLYPRQLRGRAAGRSHLDGRLTLYGDCLLHLEWIASEIEMKSGSRPDLRILLVNDGPETWHDQEGEYWAIASLVGADASSQDVNRSEVAIAGVGRQYDLEPGGSVELPVAIAVEHFEIPPGEYVATAVVPALGLTSPPARVFVVTR